MYFKAVNSQKLPEIYRRNGKDCYLDNIRQKMIIITPEETVRQKVIGFLINDLNVPSEMIQVEESMSEYGINSKLRADIVIRKIVDDMEYVLAVIECKAPDVAIDDKGVQQLQNYCRLIDAEYSMITNGNDFRFFYFDEEDFQEMDNFPNYGEMLDGLVYEYTPPAPFKRIPSFDQIDEFIRRSEEYRYVIGSSSNYKIAHIGINLYECFMDTKHKMPKGEYQLFTLIKDYGVRNLTYRNSSGSGFNGYYRSFLIKYKNSVEFVSFSVSSYCTQAKPDEIKTTLNIAIDNEKSAHHSLEYILDKNIVLEHDEVKFYHDGRMAVGNIGSAKISDLRALVKKKYPCIIDDNEICLGKLKIGRLWSLDHKQVISLMENMISYALIRDELRKKLKKQRAEETVKNGS